MILAGQEGFEPTTRGFGIRCSSRWSYCPKLYGLLAFFVRRMLTAKFAELFEFQLIGGLLLILGRGVILTLTSGAI